MTALTFMKDKIYSDQREFRFVYGGRKAFKLKQQIILNQGHDFRAEAVRGTTTSKTIAVGSIEDITIVRNAT